MGFENETGFTLGSLLIGISVVEETCEKYL